MKRLKFFQNSVSYNVKFMAVWVIVGRKDFIRVVVLEVNEADRDRLLRFGGVHTSPRDANENAKTPFRKLSMPKMDFWILCFLMAEVAEMITIIFFQKRGMKS